MPRLTLCADDFGFSAGVSRTIAALGRAGKLNATTCMTAMPGWPADAALLANMPLGFAIGLHLTLTLEAPITSMPVLAPAGRLPTIDALARAARAGTLPLGEIAGEVAAQFRAFEVMIGRPPDFVDAHQHSHGLPGIREIVLDETMRSAKWAWVRNCTDRMSAMLRRPRFDKALMSAIGTRDLREAATGRGLHVNDSFAGHYSFDGRFAAVLPAFFRRPGRRHLVMCHPGADIVSGDAIAAARIDEAGVLARTDIAALAAAHGLDY